MLLSLNPNCGQNVSSTTLEKGQLPVIDPRLIWWQMYSVPNGDGLDVGDGPSMWGDIQSCWDGWPVSLCPERSWEMIFFNADWWDVFFTPEIPALDQTHPACGSDRKHRAFHCRCLMFIITQTFNKTSNKFNVMNEAFLLFPVNISHVSFHLAVSLPPTGVVC